MGEEDETTGDLEGDEMETRVMTTSERIRLLDMENVHLRRKLAEAEQKLDMAKADRRRLMAEVAELSGKLAERAPLRVYEKAKRRAERRLRHIAEVEDAIRRRNAVIEERGERIKELQGRAELTDEERRILDMWPRFEDGEPVLFGDRVDGIAHPVEWIAIDTDGRFCLTGDLGGDDGAGFDAGKRVKRPAPEVLDADDVPIRVGDTVWIVATGNEAEVAEICEGEHGPYLLLRPKAYISPDRVTHREPDSWEKLEEDAGKHYCAYFGQLSYDCSDCPAKGGLPCQEKKSKDLVRRAKALAGIEVG